MKEIEIKSSLLNSDEFRLVKQSLIAASEKDGQENFRVKTLEYINDSCENDDDMFFYDMLEFVRFLDPSDPETANHVAYTTPSKLIYFNMPCEHIKNARQWDFVHDHECLHQLWDTFEVGQRLQNEGIEYNHQVLNIASDCVINHYLRDIRHKECGEGLVTPEMLEEEFGVEYDYKVDTQYTLYLKLLKAYKEFEEKFKELLKQNQQMTGNDSQSNDSKNRQSSNGQQQSSSKENSERQSNDSKSDESADDAAKRAQEAADKAKDKANKSGSAKDKENADKAQKAADKAKDAANKANNASSQEEKDNATKEAQDAADEAEGLARDSKSGESADDAAQRAQAAADKAKDKANKSGSSKDKENADKAQAAANKAKNAANKANNASSQEEKDKATKEAQDAADEAEGLAGNNKSDESANDAAKRAQKAADKAKDKANKSGSAEDKEKADKAQKAADKAKDAADKANNASSQEEKDKATKEAQDAADEAEGLSGENAKKNSGEKTWGKEKGNYVTYDEDLDKIRKKASDIIEKYRRKISGDFGDFISKCKSSMKLNPSGLKVETQGRGAVSWATKMKSYVNGFVKKKIFQKKRELEPTYKRMNKRQGVVHSGDVIKKGKRIKKNGLTISTAFYIDRSGSMSGDPIKNVFTSAYAICESLKKQFKRDKVVDDITFKMHAFDYDMHEIEFGKKMSADGGTMPFHDILSYITKNTKDYMINIIITDAEFDINENEVKKLIKDIDGMILFITNNENDTMKDLSKQYSTQLYYILADINFTI